jgi:hypothetical protein
MTSFLRAGWRYKEWQRVLATEFQHVVTDHTTFFGSILAFTQQSVWSSKRTGEWNMCLASFVGWKRKYRLKGGDTLGLEDTAHLFQTKAT